VLVKGIHSKKWRLFDSAKSPLLCVFYRLPKKGEEDSQKNREYKFILKYGDDLTSDRIVMAIIHLVNEQLAKQKDRIDFRLLTYRILTLSKQNGFIEFVTDSLTIKQIKDEFSGIK